MREDQGFSAENWANVFASEEHPGEGASKDRWNAKAAGFSRKRTRGGYIGQLIEKLALAPGESVFDMGCGPGTLAVPLAQAGHRVVAVDFSTAMLAELDAKAREAGPDVAALIDAHERSWRDDWSGLPRADVAVSSRSLITDDLAGSLAKLEGQARSRVAVTVVAGETPMANARILRSIGRDASEPAMRTGMVALVNYLFCIGRRPKVDYLSFERRWHAESREAMVALVAETVAPLSDEEARALEAFVDDHASIDDATSEFALDYTQQNTWAYIEWGVPRS